MIENGGADGGYVLHHAGQRLPFRVEFSDRKDLAISVLPDLRLEVVAPAGSALDAVLPRVQKRAGWIVKQLRFFEQYQPPKPKPSFVAGETHHYLGRQYRLKVAEGTAESVKLVGKFFRVVARRPSDTGRVKDLLGRWYREHATALFTDRLRAAVASLPHLALERPPRLLVRCMEKRWGSCTRAGTVLLNLDLIRAPVHCVDYVIVHELCHLKVHSHGPAFFRLLSRCMPDWKSRKDRLDSIIL